MGQPLSLKARGREPWLGIHVLTEFAFCPRAGMLEKDRPEDLPVANDKSRLRRRVLPLLNHNSVNREYSRQFTRVFKVLMIALGIAAGLAVLHFGVPRGETVGFIKTGLIVGTVGVTYWLLLDIRDLVVLAYRKNRFETAKPCDVPSNFTEDMTADWCSLVASKYEVFAPEEDYRDQAWRVRGKIRFVLRRGDTRIPVFVMRKPRDEEKRQIPLSRRIYQQHRARIAAYCHLLKTCEGAESPFGVIVQQGSFDAVLIPNAPGSRKAFHMALRLGRNVVADVENGTAPRRPNSLSKCRGCPFGRPYVRGYFDNIFGRKRHDRRDLSAHRVKGIDGKMYHSTCGDAYSWTPPHAKALRKELVSEWN